MTRYEVRSGIPIWKKVRSLFQAFAYDQIDIERSKSLEHESRIARIKRSLRNQHSIDVSNPDRNGFMKLKVSEVVTHFFQKQNQKVSQNHRNDNWRRSIKFQRISSNCEVVENHPVNWNDSGGFTLTMPRNPFQTKFLFWKLNPTQKLMPKCIDCQLKDHQRLLFLNIEDVPIYSYVFRESAL